MKRGCGVWRLQQDGQVRRGISGENGDEWCQVGKPHDHGAPMGPDTLHSEVMVMEVLRVEMGVILARERMQERGKIGLMHHRFAEKYQ